MGKWIGYSFSVSDLQLNPVGHNNTENVDGELDCYKLAARSMLSRFSGPDRRDGIEHAGPDSVENTGCRSDQVYVLD